MWLEVATPGRVDYEPAIAWQETLVARCLAGGAEALLLLEHPPVYTLGRGADPVYLRLAAGTGAPIVRTHRGGQVTYHGPGQLVGYPILDLRRRRPDVRWYLRSLEGVLIDALGDLGIAAGRREGFTGVWVGPRKIASIGVALRRWVSWHGFALNVGADLSGFDAITPCGIADVQMTSVAREGVTASLDTAREAVLTRFLATFGFAGARPLADGADVSESRP